MYVHAYIIKVYRTQDKQQLQRLYLYNMLYIIGELRNGRILHSSWKYILWTEAMATSFEDRITECMHTRVCCCIHI